MRVKSGFENTASGGSICDMLTNVLSSIFCLTVVVSIFYLIPSTFPQLYFTLLNTFELSSATTKFSLTPLNIPQRHPQTTPNTLNFPLPTPDGGMRDQRGSQTNSPTMFFKCFVNLNLRLYHEHRCIRVNALYLMTVEY